MGLAGYLTLPLHHSRLEAALLPVESVLNVADAATGPATRADSGSSPSPESAAAALILLAEDNPINQRVASLMLEKLGYRVDVAANGLEVLEMVAVQAYAAILMDVQMPQMDGLETARRIRAADSPALDPQVPIIALTAHAMKQDRRRSLAAGMDDHVSKPMDSKLIAEILARHVGQDAAPVPITTA